MWVWSFSKGFLCKPSESLINVKNQLLGKLCLKLVIPCQVKPTSLYFLCPTVLKIKPVFVLVFSASQSSMPEADSVHTHNACGPGILPQLEFLAGISLVLDLSRYSMLYTQPRWPASDIYSSLDSQPHGKGTCVLRHLCGLCHDYQMWEPHSLPLAYSVPLPQCLSVSLWYSYDIFLCTEFLGHFFPISRFL